MVTAAAEEKVWADVARRLGVRRVPELMRQWGLVDRVAVERCAAATGPERGRIVEELVADVRPLIEDVRDAIGVPGGAGFAAADGTLPESDPAPRRSAVDPQPDDYERARARAFAEAVAAAAEEDAEWAPGPDLPDWVDRRPRVRAFRQDLLGGVLTPERARAFALSPAARVLRVDPLRAVEVPPAAVEVAVASEEHWRDPDGTRHERLVLRVGTEGEGRTYERSTPYGKPFPTLELPIGEGGRYEPVGYWLHSALGELHGLAGRLSRRFPWGAGEAAWFVLTGQAPCLPSMRARYERRQGASWSRATLTLTIEPWVSAATVERVYRDLRRRALPSDEPRHDKAVVVWLFAREQERAAGRALTGPELQARWNASHPDHRYGSYSGLLRARNRGEALVGSILKTDYGRSIGVDGVSDAPVGTPIATPKPADDSDTRRTERPENPRN